MAQLVAQVATGNWGLADALGFLGQEPLIASDQAS